jgi:universal stress protein A
VKSLTKILVPTDFSELSLAAIEYVRSIVERFGSEIYLLHVVASIPFLAKSAIEYQAEYLVRSAEAEAMNTLLKFADEHITGLGLVVPLVKHGDPAQEIVRYAKDNGVGMIVMASHGRTGLAHVLLGSVAEKVVRHSSVPVLIVKPMQAHEHLLEPDDVEEQLHRR